MKMIKELIESWREYVDFKKSFFYGTKEISLDNFAELAGNTFDFFKSAKENYIYKKIMPDDPYITLSYVELISLISQYMITDYFADESEDRVFSVTSLVAFGLRDFAIYMDGVEHFPDGNVSYYLTEEKTSGTLSFHRDNFAYFEGQDTKDRRLLYYYNVYKADYSDLFELAKTL